MRITQIEITDFRSIEHLILGTDQPFVRLAGANDAGKSNILHAMELALGYVAQAFLEQAGAFGEQVRGKIPEPLPASLRNAELVRRGATEAAIGLKASLSDAEAIGLGFPLKSTLEMGLSWRAEAGSTSPSNPQIFCDVNGQQCVPPHALESHGTDEEKQRNAAFGRLLGSAVRHVGTERHWTEENFFSNTHSVQSLIFTGPQIKTLLFHYKNNISDEVQARYEEFRRECSDRDLPIGELTLGIHGSRLFARTRKDAVTLELEDRASSVQQLVFLLGLTLCHEGSVLVVEEPELNLSTDLQQQLWRKLRELVTAGRFLQQIFVTSHSDVFDTGAARVQVQRSPNGWTTALATPPRAAE
jgi:predicted ATPase